MEKVFEQVLPALAKSSPYFIGVSGVLYLVVKMILTHLKEQEEKRVQALKERDEKRDNLFKDTLTNRENFFREELDKKDHIIHHKDEEIKLLHQQVVTLIKEDIEVRKNNNVLMDNLRKLLEVALNMK